MNKMLISALLACLMAAGTVTTAYAKPAPTDAINNQEIKEAAVIPPSHFL